MANSLLMRPYILSVLRTPLLLRRSLSYLQTAPSSYSLVSSQKAACLATNNKLVLIHGAASSSSRSKYERRGFSIRATEVNQPGSIDSPLMQSMEKKIKEQLNAEAVVVKDAYGDGRHVSIDVISSVFEGQSAVNRQRMVYKAIWEELQSTVHAVDQMTTRTPSEAA